MGKRQVIFGLESMLGEDNHTHYNKMNSEHAMQNVEDMLGMMEMFQKKGWKQYIATHMSPEEIAEKTGAGYIASLPFIDIHSRAEKIPFGINYGNMNGSSRIIIASPGIKFYPTDSAGRTIMITDKLPYLGNLRMTRELIEDLLKSEDEMDEKALESFDMLYDSSSEIPNTQGQHVCSTRIVSPFLPVFSKDLRFFSKNGYDIQLGYSVFENNGKNCKNILRIARLYHNHSA